MIKFIHFSILDRTIVTVDNIYAPSDDGSYDIPEDLATAIGKPVTGKDEELPKPVAVASAPKKG